MEQYGWDLRNRLTGIFTKDRDGNVIERVAYIYDVYNRRIGKEVDEDGDGPGAATTERYVHDGDHIALVFDGEGNLTDKFLHSPGVVPDLLFKEEYLYQIYTQANPQYSGRVTMPILWVDNSLA